MHGSLLGEAILMALATVTGIWAWSRLRQVRKQTEKSWEDMDRIECMIEEIISDRRKQAKTSKDTRCRM